MHFKSVFFNIIVCCVSLSLEGVKEIINKPSCKTSFHPTVAPLLRPKGTKIKTPYWIMKKLFQEKIEFKSINDELLVVPIQNNYSDELLVVPIQNNYSNEFQLNDYINNFLLNGSRKS